MATKDHRRHINPAHWWRPLPSRGYPGIHHAVAVADIPQIGHLDVEAVFSPLVGDLTHTVRHLLLRWLEHPVPARVALTDYLAEILFVGSRVVGTRCEAVGCCWDWLRSAPS
jgi:hypothetical protein